MRIDCIVGLDYAGQRWYASGYGRFNSADPYQASAGPSDPGSWNRYAYVGGDPMNANDPTGLLAEKTDSDPIFSTTVFASTLGDIGATWWFNTSRRDYPPALPTLSPSESFSATFKLAGALAARSLSDNCQKALGSLGVSTESLAALSFQIDYFDGRSAPVVNRSLNYLFGNGDFTTVRNIGGNAFVPRSREGNSLSAVVIQSGYFLKSSTAEQAILIHEILHVYKNKNDEDLRNFLGLDRNDLEPSAEISEWLMKDCKK